MYVGVVFYYRLRLRRLEFMGHEIESRLGIVYVVVLKQNQFFFFGLKVRSKIEVRSR
jgi:hypothetical protein